MIRTYPVGPAAFARYCRNELTSEATETVAEMLEAAFGERTFGPRLVAQQRVIQEGGDAEVYMTEAEVAVRRFLETLE